MKLNALALAAVLLLAGSLYFDLDGQTEASWLTMHLSTCVIWIVAACKLAAEGKDRPV